MVPGPERSFSRVFRSILTSVEMKETAEDSSEPDLLSFKDNVVETWKQQSLDSLPIQTREFRLISTQLARDCAATLDSDSQSKLLELYADFIQRKWGAAGKLAEMSEALVTSYLGMPQARSLATKLAEARNDFEERLEPIIGELIRQEVNKRLGDTYERTWTWGYTPGLKMTVVDAESVGNTVVTEGMKYLRSTLRLIDNGSIGLAGARGLGKSTILHWLGPELSRSPGSDTEPVIVSSPTKYDPREFLLNLYGKTCETFDTLLRVRLRRERTAAMSGPAGEERSPVRQEKQFRPLQLLRSLASWTVFYLRDILDILIFGLVIIGAFVSGTSSLRWTSTAIAILALAILEIRRRVADAIWLAMLSVSSIWIATSGQSLAMPAVVIGLSAVALRNLARRLEAVAQLVLTALAFGGTIASILGLAAASWPAVQALWNDIQHRGWGAVGAALWGVIAQASGWFAAPLSWADYSVIVITVIAILYSIAGRRLSKLPQPSPMPEAVEFEEPPRLERLHQFVLREWDNIQYQQALKIAEEGALTLSAGKVLAVSGKEASERTWTKQLMGYAELVERYRKLVSRISRDLGVRVLIGIDELDKMEDVTDISLFLNSIKGLFGAAGVLFVCTISLDAAASFKRKGAPVKEVFDSCFDEVVILPNPSYADTRLVLNSKVVRLPRPFKALLHALSGGVPRELVRLARKLQDVAVNQQIGLRPAARALAQAEVESRLAVFDLLLARSDPAIAELCRRVRVAVSDFEPGDIESAERAFADVHALGPDVFSAYAELYESVGRLEAIFSIAVAVVERFDGVKSDRQCMELEADPAEIKGIEGLADAVRSANVAPAQTLDLATTYRSHRQLTRELARRPRLRIGSGMSSVFPSRRAAQRRWVG